MGTQQLIIIRHHFKKDYNHKSKSHSKVIECASLILVLHLQESLMRESDPRPDFLVAI